MNRILSRFLLLSLVVGLSVGCKPKIKPPTVATVETTVPESEELSQPGGDSAKRVKPDAVLDVPFIFWGGDVATFHANGGLETAKDSLFDKQGLKFKLVPGDDFDKQVKDYLANKTPFLRGTMSMLGQVSAELTKKPETTPVVFLQLTW